jgi:transposase
MQSSHPVARAWTFRYGGRSRMCGDCGRLCQASPSYRRMSCRTDASRLRSRFLLLASGRHGPTIRSPLGRIVSDVAVPGRKTDVKDAEWIAGLLRHGLLRPSYIPDRDQGELRELVRYRTSLVQERTAAANRLQKVLEGANVKLASVATDILGRSGRAMLEALVAGETNTATMAELARGKMPRQTSDARTGSRRSVRSAPTLPGVRTSGAHRLLG